MTTVLLAVRDAVEASRSIQRVVERAGREPGCSVVVLHVHETASDRLGPYHVDAEQNGDCIADSVTRVLQGQGISATSLILDRPEGGVAEAVAEVARDIGADLVVVGAMRGWCRPGVATAAHVTELVGSRSTVQTVT